MVMPSGWKPLGIEMTLGPLPRCLPRLPLWPSPASAGTAMAPQSTSESAMRRRFMWFPLPGYMRGMSALDDLHEHIRAHTGCGFEICEGATNLVPGEGSETADVMVVGEAPGRNEVEHWMPVLEDQLALVSPRLVVPLGRHALAHFAPAAKIGEVHGKLTLARSRALYPLYHPAAALRSTKLRETLFADARGIPAALAELPTP